MALSGLLGTPGAMAQAAPDRSAADPVTSSSRADRPAYAFERVPLPNDRNANVFELIQGRRGFLWLGTNVGLLRFDGTRYVRYAHDPTDSTSLRTNFVTALHEDERGHLWVGTRDGLDRFDPATETFVHIRLAAHSDVAISGVYEDRAGRLWVGTNGRGLIRLNRATGEQTEYRYDADDPTSFCSGRTNGAFEDRSGRLWFRTSNGLCRYEPDADAFTRFLHDDRQTDPLDLDYDGRQVVLDVVEDVSEDGLFWAITWGGLVRVRPGDPPSPPLFSNPGYDAYSSLVWDPIAPGVLWVTRESGGLYRVDTHTETVERYSGGSEDAPLPARRLYSLLRDHSGMMWAGTQGQGLVKFDPRGRAATRLQPHPEAADPNANTVTSVVTGAEKVWMGTEAGGVTRINRTTGARSHWRLQSSDAPASTPRSYAPVNLLRGSNGTLWAGNPARLWRFDPASDAFMRQPMRRADASSSSPNPLADYGGVPFLFEDASGTLWSHSSYPSHPLLRLNPKQQTFEIKNRWAVTAVGDSVRLGVPLHDDPVGRTWWSNVRDGVAATGPTADDAMAFRSDGRTGTRLSHAQVADVHVRAEAPDVAWVSTYGGGLNRIDLQTGTVTWYTPEDGLSDLLLLDILEDDTGALWISSDNGLTRLDPETGDMTRHLMGTEFVSMSSSKTPDGELVFGSIGGAHVLDPERLQANPTSPKVALTSVQLGNTPAPPTDDGALRRSLWQTDALDVAHDQEGITFGFAALHYEDPARNRVEYRLDGFDTGWREASEGQVEATYTNLDAGTYSFQVRAASASGVWSEEEAVRLTVRPAPWRTNWAYALYAIAFAGLVFGVDRVRRRQVLRHERRQSRLREAQLKAETAEARTEALQQVNALKQRFFANVSHEFRTPLALILGAADDVRDDETARRIRQSAQRLLSLVTQLLDLSRLEAGRVRIEPESGDMRASVEALVRRFLPMAEREGLSLTFRSDVSDLPAVFDPDALHKIIGNLLSNAIKFTPEGGKVGVRLRLEERDAVAVVDVKDTGPGIAADDLPYLFDRFYQADGSTTRQQGGTGIGLALANEMAELHGGNLSVESDLGFGTTVSLHLPIGEPASSDATDRAMSQKNGNGSVERDKLGADGPSHHEEDANDDAPREAAASPERERADAPPRVLVVDDHPDVRSLVRDSLPTYRVIEASNGAEALQIARKESPDLMVSDVMMPEMDGFELSRRLREDDELRHVPLLLLTARAEADDHARGLAEGADAYLKKPFDRQVLRATVARLLARRAMNADETRVVRLEPGVVEAKTEDERFMQRVLNVVDEQLSDPDFDVSRLAAEVGLSRRHLTRRLKAVTNGEETPGALIRRLRLERGRQLLGKRATVAEVAYAVGFSSPSYFSRAFRAHFGERPMEVGSDADDA